MIYQHSTRSDKLYVSSKMVACVLPLAGITCTIIPRNENKDYSKVYVTTPKRILFNVLLATIFPFIIPPPSFLLHLNLLISLKCNEIHATTYWRVSVKESFVYRYIYIPSTFVSRNNHDRTVNVTIFVVAFDSPSRFLSIVDDHFSFVTYEEI